MTTSTPFSSRSKVLGSIRKSLEPNKNSDADRLALADTRIRARAPNTMPDRSQGDHQAQVALFITEAERAAATIARLSGPEDLPAAVAAYLSDNDLPATLKAAPHPLLENVDWSKQPGLSLTFGPTNGEDEVGLSVAFSGVAETGTLALHSGPDSPTTLNFLSDHHLVVLPISCLTGTYEAAWTALRNTGNGAMPRTVNWVTGPSRSGDIDQTLLMGAHGPRSLHILILDDKKDT